MQTYADHATARRVHDVPTRASVHPNWVLDLQRQAGNAAVAAVLGGHEHTAVQRFPTGAAVGGAVGAVVGGLVRGVAGGVAGAVVGGVAGHLTQDAYYTWRHGPCTPSLDASDPARLVVTIPTKVAGNRVYRVNTSIQKHCVDAYRSDVAITAAPSPPAVNTNTIAMIGNAQFRAAFADYAAEVARRIRRQGASFDPQAPENEIPTPAGVWFHSDSPPGANVHAFPTRGNVTVLSNAQWVLLRNAAGVVHRWAANGVAANVQNTLANIDPREVPPVLLVLGITRQALDTRLQSRLDTEAWQREENTHGFRLMHIGV